MYKLLGARYLYFETYGFLQPIFTVVDTQSYFYQTVTDGLIEKFEPCKLDIEIQQDTFFICEEELFFNVNDKAAYFFLTKEKKYFAGGLDSISDKISGFLNDPAYDFLEKMEIAIELNCWGFISNHHWNSHEDIIGDFEEEETEVSLMADLHYGVDNNMFQLVSSEDEFVTQLVELTKNYKLEARDMLIYKDRYAIAGRRYCNLSNTLIRKIDNDNIFIENLKYIDESFVAELLKKDEPLFLKLRNHIDKVEDGLKILSLLQPLVISLLKVLMPVDKQKIELLVSESAKKSTQIRFLPDDRTEISEMADLVIKNRKSPALT